MIIRKEGERRFAFGSSLADVETWLAATPRTWSISDSVMDRARHDWDLAVGYEGAMRLAREGWSDGAKDLSDRLDAHLPARDKTDTWRYDVAGEIPDVGRFVSGDPACMKRHGHPKGHRPILTLAVNLAVAGVTKATAMANFGAALVAVIDKLEHSGRRVDLSALMVAQQGSIRNVIGWRVKEPDQQPDLAAIAFSLAHPAALRRIGFAMYERSDAPTHHSYGRPTSFMEADLPDHEPNTLRLQGLVGAYGRCHTLDDAIAFVRDQINKAAGETLVEAV
jgi:hypothetical protein